MRLTYVAIEEKFWLLLVYQINHLLIFGQYRYIIWRFFLCVENFYACICTKLSFYALKNLILHFNPYWQIFGPRARPYYWKTHPIVNLELWGMSHAAWHRPYYWKMHPIMDEFSSYKVCLMTQETELYWTLKEKILDEFSRICQ